jgi:hypothetical protein
VDQIPSLLDTMAPWGLTYGQTAVVVLITFGAMALWGVLAFVLRLGMTLLRMGCALLLLFACGLVTMLVLQNFAGH